MLRAYVDEKGKYKGKWSGKLEYPPGGEFPAKNRNGICPQCKKKAKRTPYGIETTIPGYKLRFCWCECGEKWTEFRKIQIR